MAGAGEVKVKTERPDEAEIQELAAQMKEANRAKAAAASGAAGGAAAGARVPAASAAPGPGGQLGILNFLTRKAGAAGAAGPAAGAGPGAAAVGAAPAEAEKRAPAPDEASWKGHFGWDVLGKCHIPYLFRAGEKYVAVRMVEVKLLNKYLNYLHQDIYSCTCIRSYYITEAEARLLNDINNRHCDGQFGREQFTQKDLVVRLSDANEFYNFLDVCYNKLLKGATDGKDKCGFIRINRESVVPYTLRDAHKYVPLFYFEGETDNLKLKADQLKGWDLSYLKFCCKVQGIRNELFASETCSVISLADIKSYFPPGTEFEEYWPNKVVDSQLLIAAKGSMSSSGGQWTRAPPAPPPGVGAASVPSGVPTSGVGSGRGRRPGTAQSRQNPAAIHGAAATGMPHAALSAAAMQAALNSGWNFGPGLTQAQTQQVLRQVQAQMVVQNQAARAYSNATMPNHRGQHQQQRGMQFQPSAMSMAMGQQQQQQPPPLVRNAVNSTNMNVQQQPQNSMNGHSNAHVADNRKRIVQIPDIPTSGNHTPYKVQKALVEGMMVPCINMKPYLYTELLMTLPDLNSNFFPRYALNSTRAMIDALGITLYKPNATQLQILRNSGKCKSAAAGENGMALIQIRDVMTYMVQFKYMIRMGLAGGEDVGHPHPAHSHPPAHHQPAHSNHSGPGQAKRARAS